MRRLLKAIAAGILPLTVLIPTAYALEEDEPGWDCKIHGNKICGLTSTENQAELLESLTDNGQELPHTL